jgi:hypothetical protein
MRRAGTVWLVCVALASPALAEPQTQTYTIDGHDVFRISGRNLRSAIAYTGVERLKIQRLPGATRFEATATYDRDDGTQHGRSTASFGATMTPAGDMRDEVDRDPDYLTVLNQPFSVQLDPATMRDLHGLRGAVPFDFPSPMTGAVLHGSLRRLPDGTLHGVRVLGVAFAARGPLNGALPDRPDMALGGTIVMIGTAYYAYSDALLLALDATLQIDGNVTNTGSNDTVSIVYKRTIRPVPR